MTEAGMREDEIADSRERERMCAEADRHPSIVPARRVA